ncbi:MAG: hypothetical protein ABIZ80_16820, partial [Bryobacteraceae bacterium]
MAEAQVHRAPAVGWQTLLYWLVPPLLCLFVYWRGLSSWFLMDDYVWLGIRRRIYDWPSFFAEIFHPTEHGTFRPLSERGFFLVFYSLFELNAFPYRVCVFLTYFADLALLASILRRITGSRIPGFCAALFWVANPAMMTVMTWNSAYMQILCGFCILVALHFLLLYVETGRSRYYVWQVVVFVTGFGVMETNLVYPFLAAGYTWLYARKYFRRTLPLFAIALAYLIFHFVIAPKQRQGAYSMHMDLSILTTFWTYWKWAVMPLQAGDVWRWMPSWGGTAGVTLFTLALGAFLVWETWRRRLLAGFLFGWFVLLIGPVLPLAEHRLYYLLTLPLMGLSAFAGYAVYRGWQSGGAWRAAAVVLAALQVIISIPVARRETALRTELTLKAKNMVMAVGRAVKGQPDRVVLLTGVESDFFWWAIYDRPFPLVGAKYVYLAPGTQSAIRQMQGEELEKYALTAIPTGAEWDRIVVLAVDRGMRDITAEWKAASRGKWSGPSRRVDVSNPLVQSQLGDGWFALDGASRWMGKRASLRLGGP